jgi:O-acetyl-ADP-ribose deacetylase (regulator of RNase III)
VPIIFKTGDMFSELDLNCLVNTVNCVGVMGKGLALEFKKRYPNNYESYKLYCKNKLLKPGELFIVGEDNNLWIVNFATKDHWKDPSQYEWIVKGLYSLKKILEDSNSSIAIPPLGCGLGGLEWKRVKLLIEAYLKDLPNRIVVFEPSN